MNSVSIELDEHLVALLRQSNQTVQQAAQELIVLELYRQRMISSGKAAELLGMARLEFIQYSGRLGIPFLDMSDEEWEIERERSRML
jgi:predicted HTH domain antitoxin